MSLTKILVLSGSTRAGSYNTRLAALAGKRLALADVDVVRISLQDYPLPFYDGDLEARSGPPDNAVKLKRLFALHAGIFIASPEYNASVAPLLKNALDWISRVRDPPEPALAAYRDRVFAHGGYRSLMALRQILELGCGATVIPDQIAVRDAANAFDESDNLRDARTADQLNLVLRSLIETARQVT